MEATSTRHAGRRPALGTLSPLLFDVAVPVGLYYVLTGAGVADTPALVAGGLIPFARSVRSVLARARPTTWR